MRGFGQSLAVFAPWREERVWVCFRLSLELLQEIEFWAGFFGKNKSTHKFTQKQRPLNSQIDHLDVRRLSGVGVLASHVEATGQPSMRI